MLPCVGYPEQIGYSVHLGDTKVYCCEQYTLRNIHKCTPDSHRCTQDSPECTDPSPSSSPMYCTHMIPHDYNDQDQRDHRCTNDLNDHVFM